MAGGQGQSMGLQGLQQAAQMAPQARERFIPSSQERQAQAGGKAGGQAQPMQQQNPYISPQMMSQNYGVGRFTNGYQNLGVTGFQPKTYQAPTTPSVGSLFDAARRGQVDWARQLFGPIMDLNGGAAGDSASGGAGIGGIGGSPGSVGTGEGGGVDGPGPDGGTAW